jgi:thiamine-phosphate pyrophosphorylase
LAIRYYITDGGNRPDLLLAHAARLIADRAMDWIQIREKKLSGSALFDLSVSIVALARPAGVLVFVNERTDIALAADADGVHLPSGSIRPSSVRRLAATQRPEFRIGVSCHSATELEDAAASGADFAVLSPVFTPISKSYDVPPLGLAAFEQLVRGARLPVLALGGITSEKVRPCLDAGAAGVAGISLFSGSQR